MKKVLIFSCDPGGANAVIPLILPLSRHGYVPVVFGKEAALGRYKEAGIKAFDINLEGINTSEFLIRDFLKKQNPKVIITGTSAEDFTERYLWKIGGLMGIPSIAIIDQWVNYGLRFSKYGTHSIDMYTSDRTHPYLPNKIIAMDEYAKAEMVKEGLPVELISVCGQPYFESVIQFKFTPRQQEKFCNRHSILSNDFLVVFASEPITKMYGDAARSYWGYTELSVLNHLIDALESSNLTVDKDVVLLVRPHPKESLPALCKVLNRLKKIRYCIDKDTSQWVIMSRANLVCGMSSMFLIESMLLNKPILSIQIGLACNDPFILSRRSFVERVATADQLLTKVQDALEGISPSIKFPIVTNSVEKILLDMERLLCPN